ncbi:MAG: sugar phosphate isomerase/epimerase [Planctomycetota bacterium]|nr:sugar phosphate isomerase/epimerase [Planctomycetota bacterium]
MTHEVTRREFLGRSAAVGIGLAVAGGGSAEEAKFKTTLKKACIVARPNEAALKGAKDAGYDGVESTDCAVPPEEAVKCREAAEKLGMKIHSVLRGWMEFNSKTPDAVAKSIAAVEQALRAAQGYGADAILVVPCRIGGPMPEAWDFKIEFDEKNGHLKSVVAGDNEKYKAYIEAHDWATDSSREAVKKLIPVAQETKVVIALENVWNSLWVKPDIFKWLVASFESPWVKAYFDIGNHVKYAPPEEWLKALGPLLAKCHAKDFKLKPDGHGGDFVSLRKGSVNWPVVRKTLEDIGYNGWLTVEGPGSAKDLDLIFKGE